MKAISLVAEPPTGGHTGAIPLGLVVVVVELATFRGAALLDELPFEAK